MDSKQEHERPSAGTIPAMSLADLSRASPMSLLVMGPAGTFAVEVPLDRDLIMGRAAECDVRIDDGKLSRKHARIRRTHQVEVTDLGSLNGTFVRDERLESDTPVALSVGESIVLGSTVVVLQRAAAGNRARHIWTHGYFEARLEEECARASHEDARFAIVRLRLGGPGASTDHAATEKGAAPAILAWWLRDSDVVAKYAPHDYEVLLVSSTPEEAELRSRDLGSKLRRTETEFEIAIAMYPADGRTPEALVEHTSRALRAASPMGRDSSTPLVSGALQKLDHLVNRVAAGAINVLVLGETGVGKDVMAQRIHERSPRAKKPLVSLNCAALSESLLESELFGHEKGAFTGAVATKPGLLESADGGTVFLDEIGEMPLGVQAKILRVLDQREVTRVGALRPRPIDVRFIAATNRDLELEVAERRFRQDLYFRLNGVSLTIPPLRERLSEIEPLAMLFLRRACAAMGGPVDRVRLDRAALDLLLAYQWPGNIRELKNVMERAALLCSGEVITQAHLPVEKMGPMLALPRASRLPPPMTHAPVVTNAAPSRPDLPTGEWDVENVTRGDRMGASGERERILDALERCAGNQSHAAKLLGISRGTLIKRIEEHSLPRPRKRD